MPLFLVYQKIVLSLMKILRKFKFKFDLISDEDEKICNMFDVIKEKI